MTDPEQLPTEEKNRMATELVALPEPQVSAPPESCIIATEDLWKTYDMGSEMCIRDSR